MVRETAVIVIGSIGWAVPALANINLEFRPPSQTVLIGDTVPIGLYAVSDDETDQLLMSAQVIIAWDPSLLQLLGIDDTGAVPLQSSEFPANDPFNLNEVVPPKDGDGLYVALAPLGDARAASVAAKSKTPKPATRRWRNFRTTSADHSTGRRLTVREPPRRLNRTKCPHRLPSVPFLKSSPEPGPSPTRVVTQIHVIKRLMWSMPIPTAMVWSTVMTVARKIPTRLPRASVAAVFPTSIATRTRFRTVLISVRAKTIASTPTGTAPRTACPFQRLRNGAYLS